MSDDDNSSGIIGGLISLILLVVLWPYILAAIGLYFAYLLILGILNWIAVNKLLTISIIAGVIFIYIVIRQHLLGRSFKWAVDRARANRVKASFTQVGLSPPQPPAKFEEIGFIPSSNLYCYWCTKKLGIQSWERSGRFYCHDCYEKITKS